MSDTKTGDDNTLSVNTKKTLTLKRPGMEQGTVRQIDQVGAVQDPHHDRDDEDRHRGEQQRQRRHQRPGHCKHPGHS